MNLREYLKVLYMIQKRLCDGHSRTKENKFSIPILTEF